MPPVSGQAVYEQRFNDQGIELLEGAEIGPDGSGVSGKPTDKAYISGAGSDIHATAVFSSSAAGDPGELDELTVTAWFKPVGEIPDGATLFSALGSVLIWDAGKQHWVWRVESSMVDGSDKPYWFYLTAPPLGQWSKPGEWTFLALVWNRREGWVRFVQADAFSPPGPARELGRTEDVNPLNPVRHDRHTIGNDRFKPERAFIGAIDNVRFFDKALDEDAITAVHRADLANEPVAP